MGWLVGCEMPVDDVGEAPLETAHGFAVSFASAAFALVVVACWGVAADLAERDEMECVVELTVAGAGETMSCDVAGGHFDGRGAAVGGEMVSAGETVE